MTSQPERITAACPRVMIAGLRGSTGKTLVALGLISAWQARGVSVAPFKKGPDYIDPAWHTRAGARPCRNLDTYLMSDEQVRRSVGQYGRTADVTLIEGNHGLFDGVGAEATASSAELATLLQTPVVLLVDCTKTTRTVAAMVLGCQHMDPELPLAGVLLNRMATPRQQRAVRTAVEEICGLPVLGSIPRLADLEFPERHLGLLTPAEHPEVAGPISIARQAVEAHVNLDKIRALAESAPPLTWTRDVEPQMPVEERGGVRVGVVRDSAFTFYYPENLEALQRLGAEVVAVNALTDPDLPPLDALYIGGGYPETHATALAANARFRRALRREIEAGLPVIAECGGLIYLGEAMVMDGVSHPMVGIFPVTFELGKRPWGHGYACVEVDGANPFFAPGTILRGHEFRYSCARSVRTEALRLAFRMQRGTGFDGERDGLVYKNVLASFCHFHAAGTREWAGAVIRQAWLYAERRHVTARVGEPQVVSRDEAVPALAAAAGARAGPLYASPTQPSPLTPSLSPPGRGQRRGERDGGRITGIASEPFEKALIERGAKMAAIVLSGKEFELDEDGFIQNPELWDEEVAKALAKQEEGIEELTPDHWKVVNYLRKYYLEFKIAPMIRKLCKETGFPLQKIYVLFPSGPAKGACKVAGLPKPTGCV